MSTAWVLPGHRHVPEPEEPGQESLVGLLSHLAIPPSSPLLDLSQTSSEDGEKEQCVVREQEVEKEQEKKQEQVMNIEITRLTARLSSEGAEEEDLVDCLARLLDLQVTQLPVESLYRKFVVIVTI